jgi:dihydrofolate reductase
MGRRTWESLPASLPDRQNIVVTRQRDYAAEGAEVAATLDDACARHAARARLLHRRRRAVPRGARRARSIVHLTEIDATSRRRDVSAARSCAWRETARERHARAAPKVTITRSSLRAPRQPAG